jgi:membrane-bound lytic murein transglycosylase F
MGFEYELISEFARQHDLQVKLVVPPSARDLIPWLLAGRGDVIAAALTATEARKSQGVKFSRPTSFATETVVARANDTSLTAPEQLAGRTVVVRKSSSYWQTLQALRKKGIDFKIEAAPAELNTEEIIAKVAEGEYDLTLADSHILDIELCHRKDIRPAFSLGEPVSHGWVVRPGNPKLLSAIDTFLKKEYRGVFYNITYKKYFKNRRNILKHHESRVAQTGRISPFDDLFRRFSQEYGFDWRLIASQAYTESRFDPKAKSWVGAQGVMQVMPRTARELGFQDVVKPKNGIHAGVKYMARMRERFEPSLPVKVRNWFALASYNAGFGHVLDARRLASEQGWNPDRWFDNVEKAMLLLSRPKFAKKARHGYCRGTEPVNYVRSIQERYQAFVRVSP